MFRLKPDPGSSSLLKSGSGTDPYIRIRNPGKKAQSDSAVPWGPVRERNKNENKYLSRQTIWRWRQENRFS